MTREVMQRIALQMFNENSKRLDEFHEKKDIDFAFICSDGTSFRVNGFFKLGRMGFVMRRIERLAKKMETLGLPTSLEKIIHSKQGLFLVTGPTGSGKSTTMVSMLEKINELRREHVVTIEDPIEFIFTDDQSIFSQREVGRDTDSFVAAIRAAMREDPDIVMV